MHHGARQRSMSKRLVQYICSVAWCWEAYCRAVNCSQREKGVVCGLGSDVHNGKRCESGSKPNHACQASGDFSEPDLLDSYYLQILIYIDIAD